MQKLRDFRGTFDLRNVVDDQDLKDQVQKARTPLEGVSADALRNMPLVRARAREGMAELATQMDALAGDRISRQLPQVPSENCRPKEYGSAPAEAEFRLDRNLALPPYRQIASFNKLPNG